jgi:hypothetical protein
MKTILLCLCLLLFSTSSLFSQDKASQDPTQTLIDIYFKSFSGEPGYRVSGMSEETMKHLNETGVWKNQNFAHFMKQIKIYQNLHFQSSGEPAQQIVSKLDAAIKKDNVYKQYAVLKQNGATSYIYTRTMSGKVTEIAYIVINQTGIGASSFAGDNIDIESIHSVFPEK